MPVTSVIPKAMFPIVDSSGNIFSALHIMLKEVKSAGIEQVGVIVSPWQTEILIDYFDAVNKSAPAQLPRYIEYIVQATPEGFGDAVIKGRDFISDEPFVLLLGDHLHIQNCGEQSCLSQVISSFEEYNPAAIIGVQQVSVAELSKVGTVKGELVSGNVYKCTDFIEKPGVDAARSRLKMASLPEDTFLAHCGIYCFSPVIFDCLFKVSKIAQKQGQEVELSQAQDLLLKEYPEEYYLCEIKGKALDIGTPLGYLAAQEVFKNHG